MVSLTFIMNRSKILWEREGKKTLQNYGSYIIPPNWCYT